MAKISVIIPVYNVENFIKRCLDSVINQTMKDLEIILIDDGSKDKSGLICDEYAKRDSRIIVVHQQNGGLSDARNKGLDIATGEYIAFLDSDDFIDKRMYEKLYKNAIENKVDISGCFFKYLTSNNNMLFNPTKEHIELEKIYHGHDFLNLLYIDGYSNGLCVAVWNKIYSRNIFESIRFKGRIYEDDEICSRIYNENIKVFLSSAPLYIYVQNHKSLSNSNFNEEKMIFIDILYERLELFKKKKLNDLYIDTVKLYLNIVIEYYFKISEINKNYEFNYYNQYKKVLKYAIKINDITLKDKLRFYIFKFSPKIYKMLTK